MILFPSEVWINYIVGYLYCLPLQKLEPGGRKLPGEEHSHLLDESPLLTFVPKVSIVPKYQYAGRSIC